VKAAPRRRLRLTVVAVPLLLVRHVWAGVADCPEADDQRDARDRRRADPDDGARGIGRGQDPADESGEREPQIAGGLVQAQREPAPAGAGEVDLHHDRHRPGEALVHAEQHVGGDDEPPGGSQPDQQRHRQRDQPADDEETLPADPLGDVAGGEVRERLGEAERDDEGEDRRVRAQGEVLLPDQREDAPFETDHRTDQRVQRHEQRELAGVRAQAEPDGPHVATPVGASTGRSARFHSG
jgi:hypothetical protein